jgi:hypothetical protein
MNQTLVYWAQLLSVPIALAAIIVSLFLYRRARKFKSLSCIYDPLLTPVEIKAGDALRGDIEIRYQGRPVASLFLATATIQCDGTLPIVAADVKESLAFSFPKSAELLRKPTISAAYPTGLMVVWSFASDHELGRTIGAEAEFELLNPGDQFTAEFVCAGEPAWPNVRARIAGVPQIRTLDSHQVRMKRDIARAGAVALGFFTIAGITALLPPTVSHYAPELAFVGFGAFTAAFEPMVKLIRYDRKTRDLRATLA